MVHILEKIQKNITSKVVVLLEGGYNLSNIPPVAESVLRCLKGESLPNLASPLQMCNLETFISNTKVPQSWADITEENMKVWSEFWPCVMDESLIKRCQKMINSDLSEIHSGHKTKNQLIGDKFYKSMDSANFNNEAMVYSSLDTCYSSLKEFLPEFLGIAIKTDKGII